MTFAKGMKRYGWWGKFKEEKLEEAKKILGHVGLYVGLICYTAFGGFVSISAHSIENIFISKRSTHFMILQMMVSKAI